MLGFEMKTSVLEDTTEFLDLKLTVQIECLDCDSSENRQFRIGDTFDLEGDYILKYSEELHLCHTACKKLY